MRTQNYDNLLTNIDFIATVDPKELYKSYNKHIINYLTFSKSKKLNKTSKYRYPLSVDTWCHKELMAINEVVISQKFTMGEKVKLFEKKFADYIGSKYAIMVNSGSSANLLMVASLVLDKNINLTKGDEVLVPAVSWATTFYPLQQYGLKARFIDIDLKTLNINEENILKAITSKTRAIFAINILGNPLNYKKIKQICKKYNLILIEDSCESLGAKYKDNYCGTNGVMGSFSFYFSHHIHTIEGGMIVTNNKSLYHHCLSLRAHGWVRDLPSKNSLFEKKGDKFEDSFVFVLPGYNLRPSEINGAIGIKQLEKLNAIIFQRRKNAKIFKNIFMDSDYIDIQKENEKSSWFGFSVLLKGNLKDKRKQVLKYLEYKGIETRPIISGNFLKNPVLKHLKYSVYGDVSNANKIDKIGFFVGNNHVDLTDQLSALKESLDYLNKTL